MKRRKPVMAHRTACILRVSALLIVVIATASLPGVAPAQEPGAGQIRVVIETIQYEGTDAYSLVVATTNASSRDILIRIIEEGFFIQTDRGWARIKALHGAGYEHEEFRVPRNGKNDRPVSINIPLTIPDLFRTYEGDLSLMYQYTYAMRPAEGSGAAFQRTDEVYCWVKPRTSQWILREGM